MTTRLEKKNYNCFYSQIEKKILALLITGSGRSRDTRSIVFLSISNE